MKSKNLKAMKAKGTSTKVFFSTGGSGIVSAMDYKTGKKLAVIQPRGRDIEFRGIPTQKQRARIKEKALTMQG